MPEKLAPFATPSLVIRCPICGSKMILQSVGLASAETVYIYRCRNGHRGTKHEQSLRSAGLVASAARGPAGRERKHHARDPAASPGDRGDMTVAIATLLVLVGRGGPLESPCGFLGRSLPPGAGRRATPARLLRGFQSQFRPGVVSK
jgi:hypothetical protein